MHPSRGWSGYQLEVLGFVFIYTWEKIDCPLKWVETSGGNILSCHIPFTHGFTTLRWIFKEITLHTKNKVASSKMYFNLGNACVPLNVNTPLRTVVFTWLQNWSILERKAGWAHLSDRIGPATWDSPGSCTRGPRLQLNTKKLSRFAWLNFDVDWFKTR